MRTILCAALLAATACGDSGGDANVSATVSAAVSAAVNTDANADASQCPPGVTIVDAWTRPARAGQPVSAAYVTICNGGDEADALVAIASDADPVASSLEIHLSEMSDGVMSMKQVDRIDLPAGARTTFEPGGAHFMLIGVEREIASGAEPTFRLEFENAEPISQAFEVRGEDGAADSGDDDAHGHH